MKKTIIMAAVLALGLGSIQAAELVVDKTGAKFGAASRVNVLPTGNVTLTDAKLFSGFHLQLGTKHPKVWFSPGECSPKLEQPDKNSWKVTSKIPATATEFVDTEMVVTATSFNTVELAYSWKTADVKNIVEASVFLNLSPEAIEGGEITINGETLKVENKTEYGWYNKKLEKVEITLFKDREGREYTVSSEKPLLVVLQSTKDQGTVVRFLPDGADSINLTITPK